MWSRGRRCSRRLPPAAGPLLLGLALTLPAAALGAVENITVVGLFRDRAVVQIDGVQYVLSKGMASPEGVKLISANSREAVLEVDGLQQSYTLGSQIRGSYTPPAEDPGVTVEIAPDSDGMYRVDGTINGFLVGFIVDTGASRIAMNRNEAKRLGIDYRMKGRKAEFSTASGTDTVYLVNLDHVRVGEIVLDDVAAAVHDGDHPTDVLLGNSFLNRINMARDGRLLELTTR